MTVVAAAKALVARGVSVVPTKPDKRPGMQWLDLQSKAMAADQVDRLFSGAAGVGIICGAVSGHLECIDFDDLDAYPKWRALLEDNGFEVLLTKLVVQRTKSGGRHVVYRCLDGVGGNMKLAERGDPREVMVETRGEGGYFVACPSPGYTMEQGTWAKVPEVSGEERDAMLSAGRMLGETTTSPYTHNGPEDIKRPGDVYAASHSWADVLEPHGWQFSHERGGEAFWVRPGKAKRDGLGATTNYKGSDLLKVFSSNAHPFEPGATYTKFAAFSMLEHAGDMRAAAKALSVAQGRPAQKTVRHPGGYGVDLSSLPPTSPTHSRKWKTAADIEVKAVDWLVEPYIPLGEITLIAGDPGDGKSTFSQAIVSHVTQGTPIFGRTVAQGNAVFLSAEQSVASVTVPRFHAMEADVSKIILPDEVGEDDEPVPFTLDEEGITELRLTALEFRPKIIVIDTATAYIEAQRDFNTANSVREWMRRLADIARLAHCAVVIITHLNKGTGQKSIYRVMGSVDFVGASRSVLMVGKDPDEQNVRAAVHIKSNVGPLGPALGFSVADGVFGWQAGADLTAERMQELPQAKEAKQRDNGCAAWLREYLSDGAQGANDVFKAAREEGYGQGVVKRAKHSLGVRSVRDKFGDEGGWSWCLPESNEGGEQWWNKS